ncbi:hypothetical protein KR018_003308 [Drosophila ironensis]|nr:hypothetical protein KR018_003308 [Drosophila ironensis]
MNACQNTTYTLKRIQFDGNDMPQYMPDFNYTLYAKFYANKKLSIEMNANGGFYQVYRRFK